MWLLCIRFFPIQFFFNNVPFHNTIADNYVWYQSKSNVKVRFAISIRIITPLPNVRNQTELKLYKELSLSHDFTYNFTL